MRIVAIHAHPEDVEILAGGTLALLAAGQSEITIVSMTPGDSGSVEHSPEDTASIRRREAASAASLINAKYVCAEFRDFCVFDDDPSRRRLAELLRRLQPEIVLAPSDFDSQPDHCATAALVRHALAAAAAANYATRAQNPAPPLASIPHLYAMDASGSDAPPGFIVDVSTMFHRKQRMVAQHRSQREWMIAAHGSDYYLCRMEEWTQRRGLLAGIEYGEGFVRAQGFPFPQSELLEEVLGHEFIHRLGTSATPSPANPPEAL